METPKKATNTSTESEAISTPSSHSSTKRGVVVTPGSGSSSKGDESPNGPACRSLVKEPHDHDVLCGRGGSINSHPGNERFRQLVEKRKRVYLTARFKREKRLIANSILSEIRSLQPSGRFLTRDTKTGTWYDIGAEKARDKTSQALRENAPSIRAEIEVEINQQRAEMQRAEDEAAITAAPSGPPHPYYQQPWGYYAPYHGYGQYQSESPRYGHDDRYERQWHGQYAERDHASTQGQSPATASVSSRRGDETHYDKPQEQDARPSQGSDHSASFGMPDFVSSVPSSIAAWTRTSFSFGGHSHASEHDRHAPPTNPQAKPLPYIPQSYGHNQGDHRQGRRMVHFEDDGRSPRNHPYHYAQRRYSQGEADYYDYSSPSRGQRHRQHGERDSSCAANHTVNAVTPEIAARKPAIKLEHHALEPHNTADPFHRDGEQQSSLLSQVANHILGSWDTSMVCANSSAEEPMMMGHEHITSAPPSSELPPPRSLADAMEDEEGQEVELIDMMDYDLPGELVDIDNEIDDIRDDEHRMPPPEANNMPPPPRRVEIDWPSKMVGCQSNWLPETFKPPSFFNQKVNPLSPSASLEMDVSAVGAEGISCTDSIGGTSLCQVFSHDQLAAGEVPPLSPSGQPELSQMPSWERSFRSKSPSTICSEPSIVSKDGGQEDQLSPTSVPSNSNGDTYGMKE